MCDSKEQYSVDEQGFEKHVFRALGMETCPRSEAKSIENILDCCGVRHHGDAYSVSIFTCKTCDFKTSFQYNEAADRYYYEISN
ncbi:unnamed protein product [Rotaria sp. Silwood1]|nr:unnamed protein product [Rotaria sp. Silwood1]CAF4540401.1 unnamed protein product [Rotaria sp. Silwood1]